MSSAVRTIPNFEAWIVVEGSARPTDIIENKRNGRVWLLGRVDNARIHAQCHELVVLSDYEGLPISMLEGMAADMVPICLDMQSGIQEAFQHGVNGLIVKDRCCECSWVVTTFRSSSDSIIKSEARVRFLGHIAQNPLS